MREVLVEDYNEARKHLDEEGFKSCDPNSFWNSISYIEKALSKHGLEIEVLVERKSYTHRVHGFRFVRKILD